MEKSQTRVKPGGNLLGNHARELQTSRAASLIFNLIINAKLRIKLSTHKSCGRKKLWETPLNMFTPGKYIAK